MVPQVKQDRSGLRWIRAEIEQTLAEARSALEDFTEGRQDRLGVCIERLHHMHGVLEMVQVYGGAMLADEMERLAEALLQGQVKRQDSAAEALMLGLVQLPAYLEKIEGGAADMPLALLPLMNDLRAAREAALVSEGSLFAPKLDAVIAADTVRPGSGNRDLPRMIGQARTHYHRALLHLLRDQDTETALVQIRDLLHLIGTAAGTSRLKRLLSAAEALAVAILDDGQAPALAVKPLFGKLDRVFKKIIDQGEEAAMLDFPVDILKNILFYVSRSASEDPLVAAARHGADLVGGMAQDSAAAAPVGTLGGPNRELFRAVGDALSQDLRDVKDQFDLFIRSDRSQPERLTRLADPTQKIADTLAMVGRGDLRNRLRRRCDELRAAEAQAQGLDEGRMMALASDLLAVESALAGLSAGQIESPVETDANEDSGHGLSHGELQQHVRAALDEALVELARAKEGILDFLEGSGEAAALGDARARLHLVAGVLDMVSMAEAGAMLRELEPYLGALAEGNLALPDAAQRDAIADVVVGTELYMRSALEPGVDPGHLLRHAQAALRHLGLGAVEAALEPVAVGLVGQDGLGGAESAAQAESAPVPKVAARDAGQVAEVAQIPLPESGEAPTARVHLSADEAAQTAAAGSDEVDAEILEVFGEEAQEVLAVIEDCFPRWRAASADREALTNLRRSFHTLKGSGRIVGAHNIGEFAWAVENLLNRVIDGTVGTSPELLALMDEVVAALPALVAESRNPGGAQSDVSALVARAEAMATGAPAPAAAPAEAPAEALAEVEAAGAGFTEAVQALYPGDESILTTAELTDSEFAEADASAVDTPDSSLSSVFLAEVEGHLAVLDGFLARCAADPSACQMDEALMRAMHTLRGSARIAGNEPLAELAAAIENLSNRMIDAHRPVDGAVLDLLRQSHAAFVELAAAIGEPQRGYDGWPALRDAIDASARSVQPASVQAAPAAEPQAAEATVQGLEELDAELLEVFLEEARELLEALEAELGAWQYATSGDHAPVARLQRTLHTIKGGARLSGVFTLGDLSHALESLFEGVVEQRVSADDRLKGLVRHAADALAQDIELLHQGLMPPAHRDFIERLEAAAKGAAWPDLGATGSVVEAEPPAPAAAETEAEPETEAEIEAEIETGLVETVAADTVAAELPAVGLSPEAALDLEAPAALAQTTGSGSIEPAPAVEAAAGAEIGSDLELGEELGEDSELLDDSQLMTDSELLADTSQLAEPVVFAGEALDTGLQLDAKVVQFPRGGAVEAEGFVARRPLPDEEAAPAASGERVRVSAEALDQMVNNAGELSIYRARLEQQNNVFAFNLDELGRTIERLRGQLRDLELETEAQILSRHEREGDTRADFDPLELDRYSTIQQLSRALSETVEDLSNLGQSLSELSRDTDTLLLQQARVNTDLQDSLLRTRMVKFSSRAPRLERVVRQTAHSIGKQANLEVSGGEQDMDRAILERMMSPLEHLLRNAVSHGIEDEKTRLAKAKPAQGRITLALEREGSDVVLTLADDGAGLDRERIRAKAVERGLLDAGAVIEDGDLYQLILQHGFSTAAELSQVSGRGVGMDVVLTEIKQLGGTLDIDSEPGRGTRFTIRLPFTLAITDALLVALGDDIYAVPHSSMDGVVRVAVEELREIYAGNRSAFRYGDRDYQVRYLGSMLGTLAPHLAEGAKWLPMLLVRSGEHRVAIQVDGLLGNRQIVVKSVGAQLSTVRWFTGGTILADGQIALILDVNSLVRMDSAQQLAPAEPAAEAKGVTVMVVDDSITVRKVTSRLLERHNMQVITAKDGVDAVTLLQEHRPDIMLLDIEMPRMDGYELARHMRSTPELKDIPIIMITSRTGDKHRNRALELGVKRYLGKPYQEAELLENIYTVLADATL
jgi:chemosensory pili system protein ChpA (sensor histidine kinase/response regulator)